MVRGMPVPSLVCQIPNKYLRVWNVDSFFCSKMTNELSTHIAFLTGELSTTIAFLTGELSTPLAHFFFRTIFREIKRSHMIFTSTTILRIQLYMYSPNLRLHTILESMLSTFLKSRFDSGAIHTHSFFDRIAKYPHRFLDAPKPDTTHGSPL